MITFRTPLFVYILRPLTIKGFKYVPEGIRTPDLQFRKLLLYPTELLRRYVTTIIININKYQVNPFF